MKGLPEQGQQVTVVAPSGASIEARVVDRDGLSTLLSVDGTSAVAEGPVEMRYTNLRGVYRIDGRAHSEPEPGVVRVDHSGDVILVQRREYARVDALVRVTYEPYGSDGDVVTTSTVTVSGGGFMLSGSEGLDLQIVIDFTLELDGDTRDAGPLTATGRVVRKAPDGVGIKIESIDVRERERLIRWVFARERLSRQIARQP